MPVATERGRKATYLEGLLPIKSHDLWSRGLFKGSLEKVKALYLQYHKSSFHQTCPSGGLQWEAPTYKVTWPFYYAVLRDNMTNWKPYISTTTMPMATKLHRKVKYLQGLLPITSHDPWSCGFSWITTMPQYPWSSKLAGWWLTMKDSHVLFHCHNASEDLVMNGVQLQAHVPTHAIFILGVWSWHALFSIIDLLGLSLSHVWRLLKILHVEKILFISLVLQKFRSLISIHSQSWYMHRMERVEEDTLLVFDGTHHVSRSFLSSLVQLKHMIGLS